MISPLSKHNMSLYHTLRHRRGILIYYSIYASVAHHELSNRSIEDLKAFTLMYTGLLNLGRMCVWDVAVERHAFHWHRLRERVESQELSSLQRTKDHMIIVT